jgi:hypothetical protein
MVRRVAALTSGGCCRDELPPRAELLLMLVLVVLVARTAVADWLTWCLSLRAEPWVLTDWLKLLAGGPHFIPLLLGWVRANWRRSWSSGQWLASACIGRPQAAVYKNCLRPLRGVCWLRSLLVCLTVPRKESGRLYDCGRFPHAYSKLWCKGKWQNI